MSSGAGRRNEHGPAVVARQRARQLARLQRPDPHGGVHRPGHDLGPAQSGTPRQGLDDGAASAGAHSPSAVPYHDVVKLETSDGALVPLSDAAFPPAAPCIRHPAPFAVPLSAVGLPGGRGGRCAWPRPRSGWCRRTTQTRSAWCSVVAPPSSARAKERPMARACKNAYRRVRGLQAHDPVRVAH